MRSNKLITLSLFLIAICVLPFSLFAQNNKQEKILSYKEERKKISHRERPIIFNNDGTDVIYYCKRADKEDLINVRTSSLLHTQVSTIIYNTSGTFGLFRHNTRIGQVFSTKATGFKNNKVRDFLSQEIDPLKIMVDFAHKNDVECFWSMRMNDIHDSYKTWYAPYLFPTLKREHPDWLLGNRENPPKRGGRWTAVDYGKQEIRDLLFRFVQEVCENYDVDGVELDFFRQLTFFKRPAENKEASLEDLGKMTRLLHRIRQMSEVIGIRRGRPILISVRVPDSPGYCRAIGLDITEWMAQDLIDLLVVGGDFRLNNWEKSVALGHKYGKPVYACLSAPDMRDKEGRKIRGSLACWRGRALNAWNAGIDGIYVFNFFNTKSQLWKELGDPATLAFLDRLYCVTDKSANDVTRFLRSGKRYLNLPQLTPGKPRVLEPGTSFNITMRAGGIFLSPAMLRLRVKESPLPSELTVKINGNLLAGGKKTGKWIEYAVDPVKLNKGINNFEITAKPNTGHSLILKDMILRVNGW